MWNFELLSAELRKYLNGKRYSHSLNVAATAAKLAGIYSPELTEKARLAGLLHDNAKSLTEDELIEYARDFDICIGDAERQIPVLLHGKVGAALLDSRFGVNDKEIMQAISDHVTGRPAMGQLSRILFVADQAAADRDFDGVEDLRATADVCLSRAVWLVARFKLLHVLSLGRLIAPGTIAVYNENMPDDADSAMSNVSISPTAQP